MQANVPPQDSPVTSKRRQSLHPSDHAHLLKSAAKTCTAHIGSVSPAVNATMNRFGLLPGSFACLCTIWLHANSTSSRKDGSKRPKDRPIYNLQKGRQQQGSSYKTTTGVHRGNRPLACACCVPQRSSSKTPTAQTTDQCTTYAQHTGGRAAMKCPERTEVHAQYLNVRARYEARATQHEVAK